MAKPGHRGTGALVVGLDMPCLMRERQSGRFSQPVKQRGWDGMKYDLKLSDGSSLTICAVKTLTDQWVYSASRNGSECGVTLIKSGENMLYALGDKLYSMENDRYRNAENLAAANMTARDFFRDSAEAIVSHFRQYGLPTDLPLWG